MIYSAPTHLDIAVGLHRLLDPIRTCFGNIREVRSARAWPQKALNSHPTRAMQAMSVFSRQSCSYAHRSPSCIDLRPTRPAGRERRRRRCLVGFWGKNAHPRRPRRERNKAVDFGGLALPTKLHRDARPSGILAEMMLPRPPVARVSRSRG